MVCLSSIVPFTLCWLIQSVFRHEAAIRTRHVTGTNNLLTCETWEGAVEAYTEAFFGRKLRITGKVTTGVRLAIENIQFD